MNTGKAYNESGGRWDGRMRALGLTVLGLCLWLLGAGCGGLAGDSAYWPELTGTPGADLAQREVLFYLTPPQSSGLPVQATDVLQVQVGADGLVPIDTGVKLTGTLLLAGISSEGEAMQTPVSGQVVAIERSSKLSYSARTTPGTSGFELLLPSGTYDLTITCDESGLLFPPQLISALEVNPRMEGVLDVPLIQPGRKVELNLTDGLGVPLSGVSVYTLSSETGAKTSVGLELLEALPGQYFLQVSEGPQQLWVGPGKTNAQVHHQPLGTLSVTEAGVQAQTWAVPVAASVLSGRVISSVGTPLEGVTVYATRLAESLEGSLKVTVQTSEEGGFSLPLSDGDYDLVFRPTGQADAAAGEVLSGMRLSRVAVSGGSSPLGDVVLSPSLTVTGVVKADNGSGIGLASVIVSSADSANQGTSTLTREDGSFEVRLGQGNFVLEVDPPAGLGLARSVVSVAITAETTALPEVRLETGFEVSYQFQAGGVGVSGMYVEVRQVPPDASSLYLPDYLLASALTDETGRAALSLPFEL